MERKVLFFGIYTMLQFKTLAKKVSPGHRHALKPYLKTSGGGGGVIEPNFGRGCAILVKNMDP